MDQITEIKQKTDIVDLIGGYISLQKSGRNYKGVCPFHAENTPSFMVSQELQIFKCFGCGESGDIFAFVKKVEGVDFPQALERLAERAGVVLEKTAYDPQSSKKNLIFEINQITAEFYHYLLTKHPAGEAARKYVKDKRKIKDQTVKEFMIGYAPDKWDILLQFLRKKGYKDEDILAAGVIAGKSSGQGHIDKFRGRIVFPFTGIDGKIVGFNGRTLFDREPKYLNSPETPVFHKVSFLFGLDKAKIYIKKEGAVFVEGQLDVISAHQAGIKNVIASSGTSLTAEQLKAVSRYTKDVYFCFDSDTAGSSAIQRAIDLAEKEDLNVGVIAIPEPHKDLDELINQSPEKAKEAVGNSIPIYDFYLSDALKRNNKETATGKKKVMEELTEKFSKVTNKVVMDHYIKKISQEVGLSDEVVSSILSKKARPDAYIEQNEDNNKESPYIVSKMSPQEYILALVLKAPLDTAQTILYKLGQKDFTNSTLQEIFSDLKEYLHGRKRKFDIQYFSNRLSKEKQDIVNELYLWDLDYVVEDEKRFLSELDASLGRLKKEATRRELKDLSDKIRQAELEKNTKLVIELSEKLKNISERLI